AQPRLAPSLRCISRAAQSAICNLHLVVDGPGLRRFARPHRAGLAAGVGAAADHRHSFAYARIMVAGPAVDRLRVAAETTTVVRSVAARIRGNPPSGYRA